VVWCDAVRFTAVFLLSEKTAGQAGVKNTSADNRGEIKKKDTTFVVSFFL